MPRVRAHTHVCTQTLEEEVLARTISALPKDHPDIATSMNNLAQTYGELGKHTEALALQASHLQILVHHLLLLLVINLELVLH